MKIKVIILASCLAGSVSAMQLPESGVVALLRLHAQELIPQENSSDGESAQSSQLIEQEAVPALTVNASLLQAVLPNKRALSLTSEEVVRGKKTKRVFVCHYKGCDRNIRTVSDWVKHNEGRGRTLLDLSNWVKHNKLHRDEKSVATADETKLFACVYVGCGKKYFTARSLAAHNRFHTGEKPFACTYQGCSKAYIHGSSLCKHIRVAHNNS